MSDVDFIPRFRPRKPKRFSEEAWLNFDEPQVIAMFSFAGGGLCLFTLCR